MKRPLAGVLAYLVTSQQVYEMLENYFFPGSFILKPFLKGKNPISLIENIQRKKIFFTTYAKNLVSLSGSVIDFLAVFLPISSRMMFEGKKDHILSLLIQGLKVLERKGASLVTLAGFTSIVSNQGLDLKDRVNVPLTTGNTLTASLAIKQAYKAAELLGKDLSSLRASVIGAKGDIGGILSKILSKQLKELVLCSRTILESGDFLKQIKAGSKAEIIPEKDSRKAAKGSDLILTATSSIGTLIEPEDLRPGAIVGDVSVPPNVARSLAKQRRDVLIFEAGKSALPNWGKIKSKKFHKYFPINSLFGCLSEGILLCWENMFESFSIGRNNITEEKINQIWQIAEKHGLSISPFLCADKVYTKEDFDRIKNYRDD